MREESRDAGRVAPAGHADHRDVQRWQSSHEQARALRQREIDVYLSRLDRTLPTLVAGDFNEVPEGESLRLLESAGLESPLAVAHESGATWRSLGPPWQEEQFDHVTFARANFDLVSATIPRGGNSDHFPVVVTLRYRKM